MDAIVKVGRLWMDNRLYRAGDTIDISEERIKQLGTSVERVDSAVAEIDELNSKIELLEKDAADQAVSDPAPTKPATKTTTRSNKKTTRR